MREGARRARDGGRIINISTSIIGHFLPNHSVYAATKAAVEAMTRDVDRRPHGAPVERDDPPVPGVSHAPQSQDPPRLA